PACSAMDAKAWPRPARRPPSSRSPDAPRSRRCRASSPSTVPAARAPASSLPRAAVVLRDGDGVEVDALEAADVDRGHRIALRPLALGERVDAAIGAEVVMDHVLVELVGAHVRGGRP